MTLKQWQEFGWLKTEPTSRDELIAFTREFQSEVLLWLDHYHPELV